MASAPGQGVEPWFLDRQSSVLPLNYPGRSPSALARPKAVGVAVPVRRGVSDAENGVRVGAPIHQPGRRCTSQA